MITQEEKIDIFEGFRKGMDEFLSSRQLPEGMKKRRSSIAHRIASALAPQFPGYYVDIDTDGADIIIWNDEEILLALFWGEMYLNSKERSKAMDFHRTRQPGLTLGFTLLPDRAWILVYRFETDYVEYLHIDKESFSDEVLKQCFIDDADDGQLKLSLRKKKLRKTSASEDL